MDEFERIRRWTSGRQSPQWLSARGVRLGIGDDAAVVEPPQGADGEPVQWLLAVDTMVETVHFNWRTMSEADVGYKALAANISDIAAMGGQPAHALVSISAPAACTAERMTSLYDGLYACAARYGVAIVGGDTTSAPEHLVISVTVTGTVPAGRAVPRSGAKPGDAVFVTGPLGLSAAGLHYLLAAPARPGAAAIEADEAGSLVQAHRRPVPSPEGGRLLAERGTCHALNDVSDGAASEAWELAEASGVSIVLEEARLPLSGSMARYARRQGRDPLDWVLYGGEDYVLMGTIAADDAEQAGAALRARGIPFYRIGVVESGPSGVWLDRGGGRAPLAKGGYNHFASATGESDDDSNDEI
ncbi:thiamine-phosphate kinase [Paenibacillus sp. IB182496]|uniref:Thiamine-monophosphate kinase n=1 Tax=Paenibacillus sabuli TaxID=2772509 RepID=A0A927BWZ3_9BACL|nr:thiamine-phosphate kinase [Paenibacillus sabuli]MBD2847150.1 thiamine-phosphate kinase [Paenibacillus sabuli]